MTITDYISTGSELNTCQGFRWICRLIVKSPRAQVVRESTSRANRELRGCAASSDVTYAIPRVLSFHVRPRQRHVHVPYARDPWPCRDHRPHDGWPLRDDAWPPHDDVLQHPCDALKLDV